MAQQRKPRKIKKIKMSRLAVRLSEERGCGPEPAEGTDFTALPKIAYSHATNWYCRFTEENEMDDFVALAMKQEGYTPKQIAAMRRAKEFSISLSNISRMKLRNCILHDYSLTFWKTGVDRRVAKGETMHEEKVAAGTVISIRDRTENKAREFIGDIDEIIDQVWTEQKTLDEVEMFKILQELEIKPAHAKILEAYYAETIANMRADWKQFPQDYNKADIKILSAMYDKVLAACNLVAKSTDSEGAKTRIARAATKVVKEKNNPFKKVKSATAAIINLKFKSSDTDLGLVSIKPEAIVGSIVVLLFNTKYNIMTKLVALPGQELSVKGTTIINVDETESKSKRNGKAILQIKQMIDSSRVQAIKIFDATRGTDVKLATRTSDEVLLLKAYR
jgi:hypothetical protein